MRHDLTTEERKYILDFIDRNFPKTPNLEREIIRSEIETMNRYPIEAIKAAVYEYRLQWGGQRGQFFPGQFINLLASKNDELRKRMQEELAIYQREERRKHETELQARCREEMDEHRRRCLEADPVLRSQAVRFLQCQGWPTPPADPASWSTYWSIAVSDLLSGTDWPDVTAPPERMTKVKPTSRGDRECIWYVSSSVRINRRDALRRAAIPPSGIDDMVR